MNTHIVDELNSDKFPKILDQNGVGINPDPNLSSFSYPTDSIIQNSESYLSHIDEHLQQMSIMIREDIESIEKDIARYDQLLRILEEKKNDLITKKKHLTGMYEYARR